MLLVLSQFRIQASSLSERRNFENVHLNALLYNDKLIKLINCSSEHEVYFILHFVQGLVGHTDFYLFYFNFLTFKYDEMNLEKMHDISCYQCLTKYIKATDKC